MEPQNVSPISAVKQKSPKKNLLLALVIIAASLGFNGYSYAEVRSATNELNTAKTQLEEVKKDNQALETKLKTARDTQRKKDLALLANVINDYKDAHGSYYTTEGTQSRVIYETELSPLIEEFIDPSSGKRYGYEAIAAVHTPSPLQLGVIQYQWLGKCAADGDFEDTTSESFAAIRTVLESGVTHCVNL